MKDTLKQYLLKKIHEKEEERRICHQVPSDAVPGEDIRYSVNKDLDMAMSELIEDGLVHRGQTLNGYYYRLTPENALEE